MKRLRELYNPQEMLERRLAVYDEILQNNYKLIASDYAFNHNLFGISRTFGASNPEYS